MSAPTVRLTPDGYVVSCDALAGIEGHGPTETAAWNDFWRALHSAWQPSSDIGERAEGAGSLSAVAAKAWKEALHRLSP
ncbi:hypothetical protein ACTVZO_38480 [Streptomyces sp. IBSNAI002]|uniref:hypothetical protein n=1 Tax=Streptomyces sp. IBSNAI002 TaxID=3457500 RepID=UPI003FD4457F